MTRLFKLTIITLTAALIVMAVAMPSAANAQQTLNSDTYIPADVARQALFQATADALGISEDDLLAQLTGDKTLQDVITADGGNIDQIEQSAQQAATDKVNALVTSGLIGKDAGAALLNGMSTRIDTGLKHDPTIGTTELQDRLARQSLLQATETATGLTDNQIADALAKGQTFAQIIKDNGGDVNTVQQAAQDQFNTSVQTLVANGDLSQNAADKVTKGADGRLDFQTHQDTTLHDRLRRDIITDHAMIDNTAKATGLTADQVRAQLAAGKTFDQIASANGVKIADIQKDAATQIRKDTQALVTAGVIGPVQADYLTHNLDKRLDYVGHHKQPRHAIHPLPIDRGTPRADRTPGTDRTPEPTHEPRPTHEPKPVTTAKP